jgi:hypothetical protein
MLGKVIDVDGTSYKLDEKPSRKWDCHGCDLYRGLRCDCPREHRADCDNDGITPYQWREQST